MNKRFFLVLPLAASLMLPAMAQQSTSSDQQQNPPAASQSSDQNAAQPASAEKTGQQTSDQMATGRQPLVYERHEGFWGKINPFARKKYVQRQMEPVRNRVNELDELTASNTKMIKDVDSRAQEGIRLANAKATEADQHAIDAGNRAQVAHQTAQQANTRLGTVEQVVTNIDQYQPVTQAELRFRPGQAVLSKKAKAALDEVAEQAKSQKGYIIEVQGFSSGRGQAAIENSREMAQSVVRYLVINHEVPVYRIYLLGMGNAPRPASAEGGKARRITGGRVEVSLLKNNVDQLVQQASATQAPASTETQAPASTAPASQGGVSGTTAQPTQQQPPQSYSPANNNAQPSAPAEAPQQNPR